MDMFKIFPSIILCAVLSACANPRIVDQIELIQNISYDSVENGVKSTVLITRYKARGQSELELLDTKSQSNEDIVPRLNMKTKGRIEYGQLRMVLFGKGYSEEGISAVLRDLFLDPKISSRVQLGVADRDASELFTILRKAKDPDFLSNQIKQNMMNGNLPRLNFQQILFNYYSEGRDPFLPLITVERGEIKVDGLALFRDDKLVARIDMRDAFLIKMLVGNSENGFFMVPVEDKESDPKNRFVLVQSIQSKAKFTVMKQAPIPSISVHITMKARVTKNPNGGPESNFTQLETLLNSYFEKEIQRILTLCRKNNVDPIGLGDVVRSRSRGWNAQEFSEIYKKIETNVKVRVNVVNTGVSR